MDFVKLIWKKWLAIAHIIGNFQGQVILTLFYILLFWPLGIPFRFLSDPLKLKLARQRPRSSFTKWEHPKESLEEARKPF